MIVSMWRRRNRRPNTRVRHVDAWTALDQNPAVFGSPGIWPELRPNTRAGAR